MIDAHMITSKKKIKNYKFYHVVNLCDERTD